MEWAGVSRGGKYKPAITTDRTTQAKTGHERNTNHPKGLGGIQKSNDPEAVVVDRGVAKRSQGAMAGKRAERLKDAEVPKNLDHREVQDDLEPPSKDE